MMKKLERIAHGAAAVLLAIAVTGCSNAAGGDYLSGIDASKYVTLGNYTGLDIQTDGLNIDPEAMEAYVSSQMSALPPAPVTNRGAQMGDTVNIDYKGTLADNGVEFSGGTAQGQTIILGSNVFVAGFEDGMVGMTTGETRELALTFPEDYRGADLAGRDVIFEVTMNSISAVSDDSVTALGITGVSTMDELEAYLRGEYEKQMEDQHRMALEGAICDTIESNSVFTAAPPEFQNRMKTFYSGQIDYLADLYSQAYGTEFTSSELLSYVMSGDGFTGTEEEYLDKMALERANTYLMIDAIAEEQGISVTDEELTAHLEEMLASSGYATVEEYKQNEDIEDLREQMLYDEVMDYLIANNHIVE